MASASNNPSFIIPNITSLVSIKLERPNYLNWTTRFIPVLRSHDLLSIVDGSEVCPSQYLVDSDGKVTSDINPAYLVWQKKDQFILAWLNATLSEKVLSTVYGLTTSKQVWNTLSTRFASRSRFKISHLKRQLQTLQQGTKNCSDYLLTTKNWADQLSATGKPIENDDLISYVVGGLNPIFTPFITILNFATRDHSISFDDFQTKLLNFEQLSRHKIRIYHLQALDCYHQMDFNYQGRHPPTQLAAMAAHTHTIQEPKQPWYLDRGANNHITSELENLILNQQPYHGNDKVTVGNRGEILS
ncbi:hypothetical protein Patl1_28420 [Pistacia atlantica]|uniref:Uncharacterized protein n=1 Tax=Pistacia atlantica TaxID=434234 RepID=A0ACC1BH67_9ROSI|nr:hypothetical protein Patl1_28420 [Pistacia atlantica]